ncbi:MAG: DUF4831 family protein [Bacteroidales bacterium]|nr:DUF4831 family protein [Bacteroidales bacterium]
MKKIVITAWLFAFTTAIGAQTMVFPVDSNGVKPNCVAYYLPKTSVDVVVEVEHVREKPGPFVNYSSRFLGISDVIVEEADRWEIATVTIEQHAVPDETKHYQVLVSNKSTASNLSINEDGVILGVNYTTTTNTEEKTGRRKKQEMPSVEPDLSVLGEDALVAGSIPKMAEMAAKQIYRIRENRTDLLSGESEHTPDGQALQRMLEEMDKREEALVALFVGKRVVEKHVETFSIVPDADVENLVVCRYSSIEGMLGPDNLMGQPIYLTLKTQQNVAQQAQKTTKQCGLYYNLPAKVKAEVSDGESVLAKTIVEMAQFGTVNYLPASLFNNTTTTIKFSTMGAVLSIEQK